MPVQSVRHTLHPQAPVVHLGNVPQIVGEPWVVADPRSCKWIVDDKSSFFGCRIVVEIKHRLF